MNESVFIIPGFHDSGPAHWQSWLQARLGNCTRLTGVDWTRPDLSAWVDQAQRQLPAQGRIWLVAHSFGCLVAATLAAVVPERVAGIVFVAPAEPRRFAIDGGLRNTRYDYTPRALPSVADLLPHELPLSIQSIVLASENDPWLDFADAQAMANRWRSHFVNLGEAGHVNTEAGYGPWPGFLQQVARLREQGPGALRHWTRRLLEHGAVPDEIRVIREVPSRARTLPRFAF
ncbi:MAG TPA: alpha/beta fold hydrolase [Hyphomicrobiales bacterium]|nr:alpha/beta fold hydrolase [Hyphomicrobiales bacterium]